MQIHNAYHWHPYNCFSYSKYKEIVSRTMRTESEEKRMKKIIAGVAFVTLFLAGCANGGPTEDTTNNEPGLYGKILDESVVEADAEKDDQEQPEPAATISEETEEASIEAAVDSPDEDVEPDAELLEETEAASADSAAEPILTTETKGKSEQAYTFEDFRGYYGLFSADDPSHMEVLLAISNNHLTVGWWMSEYETMEITDAFVDGDTLIIDYFQPADGAYVPEDIWGTFAVTLKEENGEKTLFIEGGEPYKFVTEQEAVGYGFTIPEFISEDM